MQTGYGFAVACFALEGEDCAWHEKAGSVRLYGGSKGATYERVVIIPVSTTLPFIERQVKITSNQTRAKFYGACTRAKHSVVFAMESPCENGVFKATDIHFSDKSIPAYKFSKPDSDI